MSVDIIFHWSLYSNLADRCITCDFTMINCLKRPPPPF